LNLFVYEQTRSPKYEHTHSAERRLINTDKTERSSYKTLKPAESQGYRHFLQLHWRQNH